MDATVDGDPGRTVAVEPRNGGGRDRAMSGYAGVGLRTDSGSLSAKRTGERAAQVVLEDGETVAFGIHHPVDDSGGSAVRCDRSPRSPPHGGGGACVYDIRDVGVSRPAVSHHPEKWEEAGPLTSERRGTRVYHRVEPSVLPHGQAAGSAHRGRTDRTTRRSNDTEGEPR